MMLLNGVIVGFAFGIGVVMIMDDDSSGYVAIFIGFLALVLAIAL